MTVRGTCPECANGREYADIATHRRTQHGVYARGPRGPRTDRAPDGRAPATDPRPADTNPAPEPPLDAASLYSPPAGTGERPPTPGGDLPRSDDPPRRRGLWTRWRDRNTTTAAAPALSGSPSEKVPGAAKVKGPRGKRLSAAETISDVYSMGGSAFAQLDHLPTGRVIMFQAPAAGIMLDDLVAGTALDRFLLQRVVGARSTLDTLVALIGPPALTWQMEVAWRRGDQERFTRLELLLKTVLKNALPTMLPAMRKARANERATQKAIADLLDDEDLDALGVTILDGTLVDRVSGKPVDVGDIVVSMLFTDFGVPGPDGPVVDVEGETVNA